MRLYAPLYQGDSFLPPDAAIGAPVHTVLKSPAPAVKFVRSNNKVEAANETALDLHAIEQTAQAMRGAEIARLLKAAYSAVADWFEQIETQERDRFFAASANLSDLELRQRYWERTGCAHF